MALTVVLEEERGLMVAEATLVESELLDRVITEVTLPHQDMIWQEAAEAQGRQEITTLVQIQVKAAMDLVHLSLAH